MANQAPAQPSQPSPPGKNPPPAQKSKAPGKAQISTQKFLDFKEIRDGIIILNNNSLRAVIMASSINFALMSPDEQKGKLYGYQDFLNSLEFPVQIMIQSRKLNISKYLGKLEEIERTQENQLLRFQISEYRQFIASLVDLGNITSKQFFVIVPYDNPLAAAKEGFLDKAKGLIFPARKVKEEMDTFKDDQKNLVLRVNTVLSGLSGMGISAAALDTQEIVELLYESYNPEVAGNQVLADIDKMRVERM